MKQNRPDAKKELLKEKYEDHALNFKRRTYQNIIFSYQIVH